MTPAGNQSPLPPLERDPYGEKMPLRPCRQPRVPLPAFPRTTSALDELLEELARVEGFRVLPGKNETLICYRNFGVGGVDQEAGHLFLSQTIGTYVIDRWLNGLGFELKPMDRPPGSAYERHRWYQLEMGKVETFRHAVREIARAIDHQLGV